MRNDTLTLTAADHVESRWEACGGFTADGAGTPVCAECGWLAGEHATGAVLHRMPAAVTGARRPRRLAS